jgi:putative phosphoesterase
MRILVISDTHGNYPLVLKACEAAGAFDALIHLGDADDDVALLEYTLEQPIIHVAGNCDFGSTATRELIWECEGKRLLLTHGDAYGVKSGLSRLEKRGIESGVNALLFGHTHQATVTNLSGILALNPGTLMRGSQRTSYAILEITPQGISATLHDII